MSNEPSAPAPDKPASTGSAEAQSAGAAKQAAAEEPAPDSVRIETPAPAAVRTVTIIDGTSGKRQEVVLPAPPPDEAEVEQRPAEKPKRGAVARRSIHNSP
jgi:uncharacterized protein